MDRSTFSTWGSLICVVLVVAIMMAFATPFGKFVTNGVQSSLSNFKDITHEALSEKETLEGDGQNYSAEAPTTLSFRSSAPLSEFQKLTINGQTVPNSEYTLAEGSTIVTLKKSYLKTLSNGNYEVAIVSKDMVAKGKFTVTDADSSTGETPDSNITTLTLYMNGREYGPYATTSEAPVLRTGYDEETMEFLIFFDGEEIWRDGADYVVGFSIANDNTINNAGDLGENSTLTKGGTYTYYAVFSGDFERTITVNGVRHTLQGAYPWDYMVATYSDIFSSNADGNVIYVASGNLLYNPDGNVVRIEDDVIDGGAYTTPAATITFTIDFSRSLGVNQTYTVAEGTTWAEWCASTYDEEMEEAEFYIDSNKHVVNGWAGGELCVDAEYTQLLDASVTPVITAGTYYNNFQ